MKSFSQSRTADSESSLEISPGSCIGENDVEAPGDAMVVFVAARTSEMLNPFGPDWTAESTVWRTATASMVY